MAQFESRLEDVEKAGAQLAFIAAEKREGVWKPGRYLEKHPIKSGFLLDEDRAVTKSYGLHHALGTDALNIAHPATLIIQSDEKGIGIIRYIYRGDNQLDRVPIDAAVAELQSLR